MREDQLPVRKIMPNAVLQLVREAKHPLLRLSQCIRHQSSRHEEQKGRAKQHTKSEYNILVEQGRRLRDVRPTRVPDTHSTVHQVEEAVHGIARAARGGKLICKNPLYLRGDWV